VEEGLLGFFDSELYGDNAIAYQVPKTIDPHYYVQIGDFTPWVAMIMDGMSRMYGAVDQPYIFNTAGLLSQWSSTTVAYQSYKENGQVVYVQLSEGTLDINVSFY
jgi:hypothetical protein